jgi:elongator complex protein 3
MMPGLPKAVPETDFWDFYELFNNQDFQPDLLKIYPCVVTKDSELANWFEKGKYLPYDDCVLTDLIVRIKKIIPPYVRILRLVRDIPAQNIIAGSLVSNLRQSVQKKLAAENRQCRCIRCREVALNNQKRDLRLRITYYKSSGGKEFFWNISIKKQKHFLPCCA